jgi:small subunit ribosomal protein S3
LGRKVHPTGFRLGIVKNWDTRWYAEGDEYGQLLIEDRRIRDAIRREMQGASISKVEIERFPKQVSITIHTAKPGIIIGRKGAGVNALKQKLETMTGKRIRVEVEEIDKPELDAFLVAESIAEQLERRVSFKRAMKQALLRATRAGAKGAMITCAGRLGGSEMSRTDSVRVGQVPRHTLRADIDFARAEALTTFGLIGVKVWVYKGEILPEKTVQAAQPEAAAAS